MKIITCPHTVNCICPKCREAFQPPAPLFPSTPREGAQVLDLSGKPIRIEMRIMHGDRTGIPTKHMVKIGKEHRVAALVFKI